MWREYALPEKCRTLSEIKSAGKCGRSIERSANPGCAVSAADMAAEARETAHSGGGGDGFPSEALREAPRTAAGSGQAPCPCDLIRKGAPAARSSDKETTLTY